jgi:hypothetical protein
MHPQVSGDLGRFDAHMRDAEIFEFPVTDWDRLELWRRKQEAKQQRAIAARNAALSQI